MSHLNGDNYPWLSDCEDEDGEIGQVQMGMSKLEWSPCSAMSVRRMYTKYYDSWCMPGNKLSRRPMEKWNLKLDFMIE